jgi:hypothetical protein
MTKTTRCPSIPLYPPPHRLPIHIRRTVTLTVTPGVMCGPLPLLPRGKFVLKFLYIRRSSMYHRTDKKENQIFLIYKEIQNGAVAKSSMRKGFLIYEEMRKYFTIYEEAVSHI